MLYLQTCAIGVVILLIPLLSRQFGYGRDWRLFRVVVITVMLDLAFETGTWLLNGKFFMHAEAWIYAVNYFTILLQSVIGYLWLCYTVEKLQIRLPVLSLQNLACATPLILNFLLLTANYWTRGVFDVSPANTFVRGSHFFFSVFVTFLYPTAASILAIAVYFKTNQSVKKRNSRVLAFFLVPPVAAAIVQLIYYGTFLFLIGLALSLLIVFVNVQNERITVDFLTKINNRESFIAYFERKIHGVRAGHELYLYMIDINFFKRVNDTYGHTVGDQVLIAVATQLKHLCAGRKCFLARLGGDEFSILLECEHAEEADAFAESVRLAMTEFNADTNLAEPVTLSVGYTVCDAADCSVDQAILLADHMMYEEKRYCHLADARSRM